MSLTIALEFLRSRLFTSLTISFTDFIKETINTTTLAIFSSEEEDETENISYDEYLLSRQETIRREIRRYVVAMGDLPMHEKKLFRQAQQEVDKLQQEWYELHSLYKGYMKARTNFKGK